MSVSPLQRALEWFAERDEMGGFATAVPTLFPGWEPKNSCRAPYREDRAPSFSVYKNDAQDWRFKDFSTGAGGGLVDFVMLAGMDAKQASHWLMEQAGVSAGGSPTAVTSQRIPAVTGERTQPEQLPAQPERIPAMPEEIARVWFEGVDYLTLSSRRVKELAEFRGWPTAWAQYLVDCAAISMPFYHGRRAIAFLVEIPEESPGHSRGEFRMKPVGLHCRFAPRDGEARASWRFLPNEKEHGQTTPALPYLLGGAPFPEAETLIITGGQWDALTLAFAAGWLGEGCVWPRGICLVALRGDASSGVFLRAYDRWWPRQARCLLVPDGDASGKRWFEGQDSFGDALAARCEQVTTLKCGDHKDFNDYYRARAITPAQIAEMLASHGVSLPGGPAR